MTQIFVNMHVKDHGFMFSRRFNDLDGHIWEVFWFDPTALK